MLSKIEMSDFLSNVVEGCESTELTPPKTIGGYHWRLMSRRCDYVFRIPAKSDDFFTTSGTHLSAFTRLHLHLSSYPKANKNPHEHLIFKHSCGF